jgi:tetratricopeptide (TPR) repeat protein
MPAVTAWFFACGGAALAARGKKNVAVAPTPISNGARISIAAGFLILAATPALLMLSQSRLSDAAGRFNHGDCRGATSESLKALDYMAIRPEPYQMIGYCDLDQGRLTQAVAAMRKAVEYAPRSWEYHYALAIALAEAGSDPRAEFAEARRLNPREPLLTQAASSFRSTTPAEWVKAGASARREILGSGRLTLK